MSLPPLGGNWRHGAGYVCCGTLRIFRSDFDTNPSREFQAEVLQWVCQSLNDARDRDALHRQNEEQAREIARLKDQLAQHERSGSTVAELLAWMKARPGTSWIATIQDVETAKSAMEKGGA